APRSDPAHAPTTHRTPSTRSSTSMTTVRDPHFPVLHRVHPRGWVNDPNGIVRTADGRWHVFFQYNPASARHEHIRCGHMSSPDLVTWREEPMGPKIGRASCRERV